MGNMNPLQRQALQRSSDEEVENYQHLYIRKPKLKPEAFYGSFGSFVEDISEYTEASKALMYMNLLALAGASMPQVYHEYDDEGGKIRSNLFICNVGETNDGAKGTSWSAVEKVFNLKQLLDYSVADPEVKTVYMGTPIEPLSVYEGIGSAEGLLAELKDPEEDEASFSQNVKKRTAFIRLEEISSFFDKSKMQGSDLNGALIKWADGKTLQNLTASRGSEKATSPHIGFSGDIQPGTARKYLNINITEKGVSNRFLYAYGEREHLVSRTANRELRRKRQADVERIRLKCAKAWFKAQEALTILAKNSDDGQIDVEMDSETTLYYEQIRGTLVYKYKNKNPLLHALSARSRPQVLRIALILACLDIEASNISNVPKPVIRMEHLKASLALWDFNCDVLEYVFTDGEKGTRQKIVDYLAVNKDSWVGLTEIANNALKKNCTAQEYRRILGELVAEGGVELQHRVNPKTNKSSPFYKFIY